MHLIKPNKLNKGDKIATVTLSWGGPSIFKNRYEIGVKQLEDAFGVKVVPMSYTLSDDAYIYQNPQKRAQDLMTAFADPEIKAIISTIGGDETIRLLPYIDFDVIRKNPKIFLGYSDTTANHFMCLKAGITSFYGPSIMAGFGENGGLHSLLKESISKTLFNNSTIGEIKPSSEGWTNEMLDWGNPENQNIKRKLKPSKWNFLQGNTKVTGHLIGGCMEVLEMIKGTSIWPDLEMFKGSILFFESCSKDALPEIFSYWLRNYCASGIMEVANGIIFGRPGGMNLQQSDFDAYDETIRRVLREYNLQDKPVITQMDFGHTDPMFTIPYGVKAEIDCINQTFSILENAVK